MSQSEQKQELTACKDGGASRSAAQLLTLDKGRHRWVFRYDRGDESAMLSAVSDLAAHEASGSGGGRPRFDWFDAALVSHQVARRLRSGIDRVEHRGAAPCVKNGL